MKDEQLVKKVSVCHEQKKIISDQRIDVSSMLVKRLLLVFKEGFSCGAKLVPVCLRFVVCCRKKTVLASF